MGQKVKVNPGLIAALNHFATRGYDVKQPSAYVHRKEDKSTGNITAQLWTVEEACGTARRILEDEDLMALRFKCLQSGLKKYGLERLYEQIMGEPL